MKKSYNFKKAKNDISRLVKKSCYSKNNVFTETVWNYHIVPVVKHSLMLGKKLKADLEVLEMAALLHDYAVSTDIKFYDKHHLHGARLAHDLLVKYNFPAEKIRQIKDCIINHRGSIKSKRKTVEEKIIASADAMAHVTELADMFYLTYGVHKFMTGEGAKWLKAKMQRSWDKIMPEGKKLIEKEYKINKAIIDNAIKK